MYIDRRAKRLLSVLGVLTALAGCATTGSNVSYGVQPLLAGDAAKLSTVAVQVEGASPALTVLPPNRSPAFGPVIASSTPGVGMVTVPGAGVGANALGGGIALGLVAALSSADDTRRADRVNQELSVLQSQRIDESYGSMVRTQIESLLAARSAQFPRWHLHTANDHVQADGTLSVHVGQTFLNWGIPRRPGVPLLPPGLLLYIRADVTLTDNKSGATLMKDAVIFESPVSEDPDDYARIAWWKDHDRLRTLFELTGRALATGIREQVLATPRFASTQAFLAQQDADSRVPVIERENRLDGVLDRFRHCDNFYRTPFSEVRFEAYRNEAGGDVYVGIACGSGKSSDGQEGSPK